VPTADTDRLFALPLDEFTAARNALAADLKKAGRSEEAAQVKSLAKPPVSAWVVNQLHWRHGKALDRLLAAGDRVRKTQAAQLAGKGAEAGDGLESRRAAMNELTRLASTLLEQAGHPPTADILRRITATLDALATYGSEAAAPFKGRLTGDLSPPGFEVLATLGTGAKSGAGKAPRVIPFQLKTAKKAARRGTGEEGARQREAERRAAVTEAKSNLERAERQLRDARQEAARAQQAMRTAAGRAKETEAARADLERRLEKAAAAADEARVAARHVAEEAEQAAQAVDDAERAVAKARDALAEFS
jgi:hypothetical protein